MKILKKINKGLILTLIVLLVLIMYLANVEKQRNAEKEEIRKTCEDFISFTDKYSVLPKEMQTLTEEVSKSKLDDYKKEMKTELQKLMIQNEESVKIQHQVLSSNLDNGYTSKEIRSELERKIIKISNYAFEGDQVTVTFKSKIETSTKYLNEENEEQERQDSFEAPNEEIVLQKVDGKWKIVYSNLQYSNNSYYYEDSMVKY